MSFKNLGKRELVNTTTGGTQYQVLEAAVITTSARDFPDQMDSLDDGSEPDDNSFERQLALIQDQLTAQESAQNATAIAAGMYGVLLIGTFALMAKSSITANGRRKVGIILVRKVGGNAGPRLLLVFILVIVVLASVGLQVAVAPSSAEEYAENPGKSRIELSSAYHLDSERQTISDIYNESQELDDVWTEEISDGDYVRVTFEQDITSARDISLYPRVVSGSPRIEVYEIGGSVPVAEFVYLSSNEYNKVYLKNLNGSQDTFDLRVIGGSVKFDHIIDPYPIPTYIGAGTTFDSASGGTVVLPSGIQANDVLLLVVETANQAVSVTAGGSAGTWTQVTNSPQGTGTAGGTTSTRLTVFWARYPGTGATGPTISDSGNHQIAAIHAFRGVITSGNPWDVTSGNIESTSDTSLSATGATTTVANTLVVVLATVMDDAQNFGATWTNSALANITVRNNFSGSSGNDGRGIVVTGEKATTSSYGATTNTLTASSVKGMMTIALRPPPPAQPTLTISQPDGTGDTVTVGDSYNITYTLSDPDSVTTAAFYYDTNNSGLDGTAMAGACAAAPEGTDVTCAWDTTGMTPGSYYVYGIADDGETAAVSAYSPGQITLLPVPDAPTLYLADGSNQIAFNNIREDTTTPMFRASATHTSSFNRFQLELNAASDFTGTAYTQTFSGTYSSGTQYNLLADSLSPSLPATDGATYYVRARASDNGGANWSNWSSGTWSFTKNSVIHPDWFQTTDAQFATGTLDNVATTGSGSVQLSGGGAIAKAGTDTSGTSTSGTATSLTFSHTLVSGSNRMVAVAVGIENAVETIDVSSVTYGGNSMMRAVEQITPGTGYIYSTEIWYILEADLPSNGSQDVVVTLSGTANTIEINAFAAEYTGVSQGAPEATNGVATTSSPLTNTISPSSGAWVVSAVGAGNAGTWTHGESQTEVLDFNDSSSSFAVAELQGASGETSLSSSFSGTMNRGTRVAASWAPVPPSGTVRSPLVDFDWVPGAISWGIVDWSENETNGSISVQIYYDPGTGPTLVSNGDLPGNTAGFSSGPVDISGLNTTTYNELYLVATLTDSGGSPLLLDWEATWAVLQERSVADSLTVTNADAISRAVSFTRAAADSFVAGDSIGRTMAATKSVSDSLETTDDNAKLLSAVRSTSDSMAVVDSAARLAIIARSAADSLGASDSLARMFVTTRSASEALGVSDSPSRAMHVMRSPSETLAVTDTIARTVSLARSVSSSLEITDLPSRRKALSRSTLDALGISDFASHTKSITRHPFTGLGITDEIVVNKAVSKQLSDSLDIADSSNAALAASRALADGLTITEEASKTFSTSRIVSESLAATDELVVSKSLTRSLGDTFATSDSVARTYDAARNTADSLSVTDSPAATSLYARSISDSLDVADALRGQPVVLNAADQVSMTDVIEVATSKGTSDSVSVSDDVAIRLMRAVSDSLSLDDALSVSLLRPVSDSLVVSDSLSYSITRSVSDSVAVTDSMTLSADMSRQASDELAIDDTTRLAFTRNISDSLLANDSASALKVFGRVIGDSLDVADGIGRSLISSIGVSDDLSVSESLGRAFVGSRSLADSLSIADSIDVAKTYNRQANELLAVADSLSRSLVSSREVAEPIAVSDAITTGLVASRQVSEGLAVGDAVVAGKIISVGISDALGIADASAPASAFARSLDDALVVAEEIVRPPIFNERITITDSISVSHARSLSDNLQASDEIRAPRFITINDSIGVTSSMYVAWSGTLQFNESFALTDGTCLPGSCIHNLALGESLAMQDGWVPPPDLQETLAIAESISVSVTTAGPMPVESISVADRPTTILELVPPAVPDGWGLTEMPSVIIAGNGTSMEPPAAPLLPGTYEASGGVEAIVQDTGMPTYDVGSALAGADMSDQTMVIPMFRVSMNPSADLPARNGLISPVVSSIPANTRVSVPVNVNATVADLGVNHPINWIGLNYTPAVGVTDFALLVSMLDSEPEGAQAIPDDMARFYLDVRWIGTFAGAERPSDPSFYAAAPTFSFAITEVWAEQERMVRDSNDVPVFTLSLLNEVTGEWEDVTDIDSPSGAVDGLYEYVAHLEHLSTYAVTAETMPAGSVGGGRDRDSYEVELEESLQVSEQLMAIPIEVIEEPGAREFTVRLADSLAILTQQVAVKTFTVRDMVDVTITVQSVERTSVFPPQVTATFRVDVINRGQEHEAFDLLFSYFDQSGKETYSSSRLVEVGPLERTRFALEIPFTSPGTFQVNIEARSIPEGKLLSTSQQLVEVPWLEVNLYLLIMAIIAVLGGTAAALALFGPKYFAGRPGQQVFSLTSDNKKHGRAGKQNPIRYFFGKRRPEGRQSD